MSNDTKTCPRCGGSGQVDHTDTEGTGLQIQCPVCGGTGEVPK